MRKLSFVLGLLCLGTLPAFSQTTALLTVPANAVGPLSPKPVPAFTLPPQALDQLENLKELTKAVAVNKPTTARLQAEARPEVNRLLVRSVDEFVRVTRDNPTPAAYLLCLDNGLERVATLMANKQDLLEMAEYFQELLEIVGVPSSEGRLAEFAAQTPPAE